MFSLLLMGFFCVVVVVVSNYSLVTAYRRVFRVLGLSDKYVLRACAYVCLKPLVLT